MAASVRRPRARPLVATAVLAVLLVLLSGCVKLNADLQVDAEENLTGSMQILVDPVTLEDLGSPDPSQELDDAVQEARSDPEVPAGVTIDRVEDEDGYIGMGVSFDAVPASEFQSGGGGLGDVGVEGIEVVSTDGEITFSMTNPLVAGMGSADPYGSASGMPSPRSMFDEAVVAVTFPGSVISAEGAEVDGSTATWNLRDYDGDTLAATGDASGFPWVTVLIVVGAAVLLLIAAGVVVLLLVLRKRRTRAGGEAQPQMVYAGAAGAPAGMGPGPGQYPGGPQPGQHPGGGQPGRPGQRGQPGQPGQPGQQWQWGSGGPQRGPGQQPGRYRQPAQPGYPGHAGEPGPQNPRGPQGRPGPYGQPGGQGQPGPLGPGPHGRPGPHGPQQGDPHPQQGAPGGAQDDRRFAPPRQPDQPDSAQDPRQNPHPVQDPHPRQAPPEAPGPHT